MPQEGAGTRKLPINLFEQFNRMPNALLDVSGGEGISFLEENAVRSEVEEGRLIQIPICDYDLHLDIYHVYLKKHNLSTAARAFFHVTIRVIKSRPSETPVAMK